MTALEALRGGDLQATLESLRSEIRDEPSATKHRVFYFQLLSVLGDWNSALKQLHVAGDLEPEAATMAKAYQEILQCEAYRRAVFAGERSPMIFGEPEPWLAQLIEASHLTARGQAEAAADLREKAFEAAPTVSGRIESAGVEGSAPFEWIADGETRIAPVLEVVVNGRYYWAPMHRIAEVQVEAPADLRDLVWAPAHFRWANQGEAVGVIPTRYAGSESHEDDAIRLARRTDWVETPGGYSGAGQRVFVTDSGEHPLLDVRRIVFDPQPEADGAE